MNKLLTSAVTKVTFQDIREMNLSPALDLLDFLGVLTVNGHLIVNFTVCHPIRRLPQLARRRLVNVRRTRRESH